MAVATWVGGDGTGAEQTDYGRTANWSGGVVPDADDHVIVANTGHNCKLDANRDAASLTVNSGATLDGSGAKLSIKSEGTASEGTDGYAVNIDGIIAGNLDLEINTPAATNIDLKATSGNVRNVTINHASCAAAIADGFMTITGNLTITAGSLNTGGNDLTVAGYCDVTGTLTLNDSAVSVAALRTNSGAAVTQGSNGTLALATGSTFGGSESVSFSWKNSDGTSDINLGGTITISGGSYFQPRTAPDYASVVNNVVWNVNQYWVDKMTFGGTLVVNASKKMETYNGSNDCIVNGDVTLNGELKALGDNVSAMEFKSLTIANTGTYKATSGTTTITGANSNNHALEGAGTFTHNNGTLEFSNAGYRMPKSGTFNNVTVNGISSTGGIHCMSYSMLPHGVMPDGTSDNETISILGKLHIKNDDFRPYQVGDIFIHHLEIGDGTGSAETAMFGMNADDVFDGKVVVDNVTIHSDGKLRFGDGDETSTTVGSSAMEVRGAFRNIGGSIDIV